MPDDDTEKISFDPEVIWVELLAKHPEVLTPVEVSEQRTWQLPDAETLPTVQAILAEIEEGLAKIVWPTVADLEEALASAPGGVVKP